MATDKTVTVTVGCKLPHGLHLDIYNDDGTLRDRVTVAGANSTDIIGGHGVTLGVPKAHFDEWMRRNKGSAAVRNELIFAHDSANDVAAQARSNVANKTGFEGINPDKPDESGRITKDETRA
jgi:hypothetical protein